MSTHMIITSFDHGTSTNFANSEYIISVIGFLTDGMMFDQMIELGISAGTEIHVPFSLSHKEADALIRKRISYYINLIYNLTIEPDDIYFPMAS